MTPYYVGPLATLYVGDCRDVVPSLPAQSADLLIADPPYGVRWQSGFRKEQYDPMVGDDGLTDWPAAMGAIARHVLREFRHAYVFGYKPTELANPMQLGGTAELIWDKNHVGMGNLETPWGPEHEVITFGVRVPSAANRKNGRGALAARLRQGSVIRAKRANSGRVRHPDEKPVVLLRQLVESSSCIGDTVVDPTCGVGSTGVAALLAGRQFVGIELDMRYADIAVDRLKAAERIAEMAGAA